MTKIKTVTIISLLFSSILLGACGKKDSNNVSFTNDEEIVEDISAYTDQLADTKIKIDQNFSLNQEFTITYQTKDPDGSGRASFKARSIKQIDTAGQKTPDEGKKLILVEISVMGDENNKGSPSTFNQIGDNPSPQFVLIDKNKNKTLVETTYYSDGYTQSADLFELSKITMDHQKWVTTAIVFQIDADQTADLAFRFINPGGQPEFYDIN